MQYFSFFLQVKKGENSQKKNNIQLSKKEKEKNKKKKKSIFILILEFNREIAKLLFVFYIVIFEILDWSIEVLVLFTSKLISK